MATLSPDDSTAQPHSRRRSLIDTLGGLFGHHHHKDTPASANNTATATATTVTEALVPPSPNTKFIYYHADASYNKRAGKASIRRIDSLNIQVVGWIGTGKKDEGWGTLEFKHIDGGSSGGTRLVQIHYISADGPRDAYLSVSGGDAQKVTVGTQKSGQKWGHVRSDTIELQGFKPGRNNTIVFSNPSGWAPDIYRIGVEQPAPMAAAQAAGAPSTTTSASAPAPGTTPVPSEETSTPTTSDSTPTPAPGDAPTTAE